MHSSKALLASLLLAQTAFAQSECRPIIFPDHGVLSTADPKQQNWIYSLGGDPNSLRIEFYNDESGTVNLNAGVNTNYSTCMQCVLLFTPDKRVMFQSQGTLSILGTLGTNPLPLAVSNVKLVEVTIDPNTFESTPVIGGDCYVKTYDTIFVAGFEG